MEKQYRVQFLRMGNEWPTVQSLGVWQRNEWVTYTGRGTDMGIISVTS